MTAKKKAQELFDKFYILLFFSDSDKSEEILVSILAKKCAELTVDEMISLFINECEDTRFLKKVKQEIEKL